MDVDKSIIQEVLNQQGEILDKLDKLENKIEILTKTSKFSEKTLELLKLRKKLTKKELIEELGMSKTYWRGWKDLIDNLKSNPQVEIHSGTGRAETILIYLNENTIISMASKLFRLLVKGRDYNIEYICKELKVSEEKSKKILKELSNIFGDRIKIGMGVFKKVY